MRNALCWAGVCAVLLVMPGCSLLDWPAPPFDASGTYTGNWEGQVTGGADTLCGCSAILVIDQRMGSGFPANYEVKGNLYLNLTCPSLMRVLSSYGVPASVTVPVSGLMLPGKQMFLSGASRGAGANVYASIDGTGRDVNGDGVMDALDGDFELRFVFSGTDQVSIAGTIGLLCR